MAIFEYQCNKCGETDEIETSLNNIKTSVEKHLKKHAPICKCDGKKNKMRRLFSPPVIVMPGPKTIGDIIDQPKENQKRSHGWFDRQSKNKNRKNQDNV